MPRGDGRRVAGQDFPSDFGITCAPGAPAELSIAPAGRQRAERDGFAPDRDAVGLFRGSAGATSLALVRAGRYVRRCFYLVGDPTVLWQ